MCDSGFISIIDPFLNPDGTQWTGSITYTLLYATTVAGVTIVNAEQQFNVVNGINLCLAPGLYSVNLQQNGINHSVNTSWGVPATGGPYTVAQISSNVTLQASPTLQAKVVLTEAQMLTLNASPVTLIPAPGVGFAIQPFLIAINQLGTPSYTNGDESFFAYLGATPVAQLECFGTQGGEPFLYSIATDNNTFSGATSLYENLALTGTTSIELTGSGSNVIVTVYYMVVPLS
jgi:hypothetical protein